MCYRDSSWKEKEICTITHIEFIKSIIEYLLYCIIFIYLAHSLFYHGNN